MYDVYSELKAICSNSSSDEEVKAKLASAFSMSNKRSLKHIINKLADSIKEEVDFSKYVDKVRQEDDVIVPEGKYPVVQNIFNNDGYLRYEETNEAVCWGDRVLVVDQNYSPFGVTEREVTGELLEVTYGKRGFIQSVLIYQDNDEDHCVYDFDDVVYKPEQ